MMFSTSSPGDDGKSEEPPFRLQQCQQPEAAHHPFCHGAHQKIISKATVADKLQQIQVS
jgi:hypothetical protein